MNNGRLVKVIPTTTGLLGALAIVATVAARPLPVPTTPADFFNKGTQPNNGAAPFYTFNSCVFCHADYEDPNNPGSPDLVHAPGRWAGSLHAHAAHDPVFLAGVAIANQSAAGSGEFCFRCHAPAAWLEGRVAGHPDGSGLTSDDFENGVSCHFCHRAVDPIYNSKTSPPEDVPILAALGVNVPTSRGNAQYVIDDQDRRRGPFNLDADWQPGGWIGFHEYIQSEFHTKGDMCGTCHDVSNPVFTKSGNSYVANPVGQPHPTGNPYDMFPEQRTYSEWLNSAYANGGVDLGGRFGGNSHVVSQCQNCHMPDTTGTACQPDFGGPVREDDPHHGFAGANRQMIDVIQYVYSGSLSYYAQQALEAAKTDVDYMLDNATDMTLTQTGAELSVRIINQCGHKLFTGYPEGRRAWINVQFFNAASQLIGEKGHYDGVTATLTASNTKVYETKHGLDAAMSAITGINAGESFWLVLNNVVLKDNRIPPRGFTNAAFQAIQSPPIGATYADGQHWDDTAFLIPQGTASVRVRFFHQAASREYMEFLLNENNTNSAGAVAYNAWIATGMSPPHAMDDSTKPITPFVVGDLNGNGHVNTVDLTILLGNFGLGGRTPSQGDINGDGLVNTADLVLLLNNFGL